MNEQAILAAFTRSESLPSDALRAAGANRAYLAPLFIEQIEVHLALRPEERPEETPFFFIFHLLGDWQETAAYRPLARLLRLPDDELHDILGDAVISTSNRVMLGVFDGDPQPLFDVVLDEKADRFVRYRMCRALWALALRGDIEKKRVATFLRDCFMHLHPQSMNYVWVGWMEAIARLGLSDYATIVETAFRRRWIDPCEYEIEHFYSDLAKSQTEEGRASWLADNACKPFGDTIAELSHWAGFNDEVIQKRRRDAALAAKLVLEAERRIRSLGLPRLGSKRSNSGSSLAIERPLEPIRSTKIGRNNFCPCGSGKKYKKCCATTHA